MSVGRSAAPSYRKWRTERKVTMLVGLTWLVPMAVFFTSIFGWQHFVGYRSVPAGKCYVQYMEDALFNCLLQVRAGASSTMHSVTLLCASRACQVKDDCFTPHIHSPQSHT